MKIYLNLYNNSELSFVSIVIFHVFNRKIFETLFWKNFRFLIREYEFMYVVNSKFLVII